MGVFRGMRLAYQAIRKSQELRRISQILGAPSIGIDPRRPMSNLRQHIDRKTSEDKALDDLHTMCMKNDDLCDVMKSHSVDRAQIDTMYVELVLNGARCWTKGYYVAAATFAFATPLRFYLEARGRKDDIRLCCISLNEY